MKGSKKVLGGVLQEPDVGVRIFTRCHMPVSTPRRHRDNEATSSMRVHYDYNYI